MAVAYSQDLRKRVLQKKEKGKTVHEIMEELGVSKTFVYDMIALEKKTGDVMPKKGKPGPKPSLDENDLNRIRNLIFQTPDMTLEEIKEELGLNVAISTICDAINYKLKLKYKKKHYTQVNRIDLT